MTTPRKTTTRRTTKTTENKEVENLQVEKQTEQTETVAEDKPTIKPKTTRAVKKQSIDQNELIACRSTRDNLIYISKRTSESIEWTQFGDVNFITFGELVTMKATQPRFLRDGWIYIDDEEAAEQLGLSKQYENLFDIDDIENFFSLSLPEMEKVLVTTPKGIKNSIATMARQRIESGELDSRSAIKLLEEKLDVDLKIFE